MKDYLSGVNFGLHESVKVHRLANIAGNLKCGRHCRIDAFVTITGNVTLGDYVHISTAACIFGTEGVTIGTGCSLSPGAKIFTSSVDMSLDVIANPQLPNNDSKKAPVTIGEFSIVGAGSVVLPGVKIGDEVQVGCVAVVRSDIPDNQVWAGVPAHFIHERKKLDRNRMLNIETIEA